MDKMALTKKRKEDVVKMLQSMTIKTDEAGGFVKEDVYTSLQDLCNLYEENISKLEMVYDGEFRNIQQQVVANREAMEQKVAEMREEMAKESDLEKQALQQKLEKYRQIKQGMMQQLLTGKIRLV